MKKNPLSLIRRQLSIAHYQLSIAVAIALLALTSCQADGDPTPDAPAPGINLIIPAPTRHPEAQSAAATQNTVPQGSLDCFGEPRNDVPAQTRVTWPNDPTQSGQWDEGDKLYIQTAYIDETNIPMLDTWHTLIALRSGDQWIFSSAIPAAPDGAAKIYIAACYVHEYSATDPSINAEVLYSAITKDQLSGDIELPKFWLTATRLTLTGLAEGDEVSFDAYEEGTHEWGMTNVSILGISPGKTIPTLTADADGTLTLYAQCVESAAPLRFRINGQPETDWYTFTPPAFEDRQYDYNGKYFKIDCDGIKGSDEYMNNLTEMIAERDRFLAWADRCRAITTGDITEDFTLQYDIDLTGINWVPIGTSSNSYAGTFDGGGFTISGLKVDVSSGEAGLFGNLIRATIKNLTLSGATVTSKDGYSTGAIAGYADNTHLIACRAINCTVTGGGNTGGIIGFAGGSTLVACHTRGGSIGGYTAGGIVGTSNQSTLIACVAQPQSVKGNHAAGTLVGSTSLGKLTACWWNPIDEQENIGENDLTSIDEIYPGGPLTNNTITTTAADEMNAAIGYYNRTASANRKCTYQWKPDSDVQ